MWSKTRPANLKGLVPRALAYIESNHFQAKRSNSQLICVTLCTTNKAWNVGGHVQSTDSRVLAAKQREHSNLRFAFRGAFDSDAHMAHYSFSTFPITTLHQGRLQACFS